MEGGAWLGTGEWELEWEWECGGGAAWCASDLRFGVVRVYQSVVVNGAAQPRDAWLSTAAAEVKFVSGRALAASLESQWVPHATSYSGKGSFRYQW